MLSATEFTPFSCTNSRKILFAPFSMYQLCSTVRSYANLKFSVKLLPMILLSKSSINAFMADVASYRQIANHCWQS